MAEDWVYDPDPLIDILTQHQRHGIKGCMCGWSVLGASWAAHVAEVIYRAGFRRDIWLYEDEPVPEGTPEGVIIRSRGPRP